MRISPEQGLQFSQMLVQDEEPLADITQARNTRTMYLYHTYLPYWPQIDFIASSYFHQEVCAGYCSCLWTCTTWHSGDLKVRGDVTGKLLVEKQNYSMTTSLQSITNQ